MAQRFRFTKTKLEGLELPPQGHYEVYDSDVPRLACRIRHTGARAFYVVKRADSKVEWVRLGTFQDMTVEQARKAAERTLGAFAAGVNPAAQKRLEREKHTLQEAFDAYFDQHVVPQGVKRSDEIKSMWERFLGNMPDLPAKKHGRKRTKHPAGVDWTERKLDAIDNAHVRTLHAEIGKTHRTYANRVVELVSTIYNRAAEWGYRGANPARGIKPFREAKRARFLNQHDPGELQRFFTALAADTSKDFQHFVYLSLLTGARRNNVLGMRWQDINMQTATWTIPEEAAKNDEAQVVALVSEAIRFLKERGPKTEGYVFAAPTKTGYATPPKGRWSALLARAKVSDLRIHDLRRSLGSWQAISGASLAIIGKSLGHKSPSATAIYARLHLDPVRASLNLATSAMLKAAGVKKPAEVVRMKRQKRSTTA